MTNPATRRRIEQLVERYGPGCFYCGADLPVGQLTIDEFVPRARGGRRVISNQRPACFPCNNDKGYRDPHEWLAARAAPPPPKPRAFGATRRFGASLGHFGAYVRDGIGCAKCVLMGRWATTRERCARCGTIARDAMLLPEVGS